MAVTIDDYVNYLTSQGATGLTATSPEVVASYGYAIENVWRWLIPAQYTYAIAIYLLATHWLVATPFSNNPWVASEKGKSAIKPNVVGSNSSYSDNGTSGEVFYTQAVKDGSNYMQWLNTTWWGRAYAGMIPTEDTVVGGS